jgi:hypothetical protein
VGGQEQTTMEQPNEQTIITEDFAVKVYKTGRGVIAEVAESKCFKTRAI